MFGRSISLILRPCCVAVCVPHGRFVANEFSLWKTGFRPSEITCERALKIHFCEGCATMFKSLQRYYASQFIKKLRTQIMLPENEPGEVWGPVKKVEQDGHGASIRQQNI